MMANLQDEQHAAVAERLIAEGLISLTEVAEKLPTRNGKRRTTSTVKSWAVNGRKKGLIRLEAFAGPTGWWTSWAAVYRFFGRLTGASIPDPPVSTSSQERDLQRRDRAARQELQRRFGLRCPTD